MLPGVVSESIELKINWEGLENIYIQLAWESTNPNPSQPWVCCRHTCRWWTSPCPSSSCWPRPSPPPLPRCSSWCCWWGCDWWPWLPTVNCQVSGVNRTIRLLAEKRYSDNLHYHWPHCRAYYQVNISTFTPLQRSIQSPSVLGWKTQTDFSK